MMTLQPMSARFQMPSQGTVRPRTETVISAEVSGAIASISPKFVAGGLFAARDVLMRIDPTSYSAAVEQAEALVNQRQIEFDGASRLWSQGYRAEAELASAAAALASARAELVRARRNFERTFIRLPYAGIVRAKDADIGQFVNPGTRPGVAFATDFAEVRLPLTDADLAFVELPAAEELSDTGEADGPIVTLTAVRKGQPISWPARITHTEGVVVNDSLILIDFANKYRADGATAADAMIEAGTTRFRAIILTSVTTAAGLMPILFEASTQAQIVIPMAISISFGIVFAAVIMLFLVPSLYLLQEDFSRRARQLRRWLAGRPAAASSSTGLDRT